MEIIETTVNDLIRFRDHYIYLVNDEPVLPLDCLTKDPVEVFSQHSDLRQHLTNLIRTVVQASDEKPERILHKLSLSMRTIEQIELSSTSEKARALYLRGKALNIIPVESDSRLQFSHDAKKTLLEATSLDPGLSEAWCELAEHEWMTDSPEDAIPPLQSALRLNMRNSEALWRLSMLLRQLPPDANKRVCESLIAQSDEALSELLTANSQAVDGLSLSLRLAHAAVKAAPTSGRAWECLGNALLTAFLSDQPAKTAGFITRSLAAFAQALKDPAVASEPHFHYNRAAALHYQDSFAEALTSWFRGSLLDPAWQAPRITATRCLSALQTINNEVNPRPGGGQSRLTRRRLAGLAGSLSPCLEVLEEGGKADKGTVAALAKILGPYSPLSSSQPGKTTTNSCGSLPKLQLALFEHLKAGPNIGKVCCGRVVTALPCDTDLALNVLLVDAKGSCIVLRIFQIGKDSGPAFKDVIAIPDPFVEHVSVPRDLVHLLLTFYECIRMEEESSDDEGGGEQNAAAPTSPITPSEIDFRVLRVATPEVLSVNGRRVGRVWTAPPVLKNVFFSST